MVQLKLSKNFLLLIILMGVVSFSGLISAAGINDTFHLNIQTTYSNGSIQSGNFVFGFNLTESSSSSCVGPVVYNHSVTRSTDSRGVVSIYLPTAGSGGGNLSTLDFDVQYYLCYYKNGSLEEVSQLGRTPYSFRSTDVNISEITVDSNLTLGNFNVSASSGLFTFLGSLVDRITEIFATDADISNNLVVGGNLSVDTNTLFVESNSDRVGIGTNNPTTKLFVTGAPTLTYFNITSAGTAAIFGSDSIDSGEIRIDLKGGSGSTPGVRYVVGSTAVAFDHYNSSTSSRDFQVNGNTRLSIASSGFVGINTTSPTQTLSVNGNLSVNAVGAADGFLFHSDTGSSYIDAQTNHLRISTFRDNDDIYLIANSSIALFIDATNQNVGIGGTNSPKNPLNVIGSGNFTGNTSSQVDFCIEGGVCLSGTGGSGSPGGANGAIQFYNGGSFSGNISQFVINSSNGNVGIGTSNPRSALDLGDSSGSTDFRQLRLGQYFSLAETTYVNQVVIGLNAYLNSSNSSGSYNRFAPVHADGTGLVLSENGGGTGDLDFYGIDWGGDSSEKDFPTDFTSVFRIEHDGNIGINTTNPQNTLEVRGDINASGIIYAIEPPGGNNYMFSINAEHSNGPRLQLGTRSSEDAYFEIGAFSNINNFDSKNRNLSLFTSASGNSNQLYLSAISGYVGINTSLPRSALDVSGGGTIDQNTITVGDTNFGGVIQFGNNDDVNFIQYASSEFGIYTNQVNGFRIYTDSDSESSNPEFSITNGGFVGIGIATPNATLHVNGNSSFGGDVVLNAQNITNVGCITFNSGGQICSV